LSPKKTEIDHLKEMMRKSGLPLELEIINFLNSKEGWRVSTNSGYLDKDSGNGREIDITAKFVIEDEINKEICFHYVKLLIECKKIPANAWVFVKAPFEVYRPLSTYTSVFDVIPSSSLDAFPSLPKLHYYRNCPITIHNKEFILDKEKSNKRDDNLYGSVVSLAKATAFEVETDLEDFRNESKYATVPPDWLTHIYPIIVFDGKMYLAEAKDDFNLTPIKHVVISSSYISGHYSIDLGIDVVHRTIFKSFFNEIDKDIRLFRQHLGSEEMQKFREEVRNTVKLHRQKDFSVDV